MSKNQDLFFHFTKTNDVNKPEKHPLYAWKCFWGIRYHVSIDQIKNTNLQIVVIPHKIKTQLTSRWKN